MFSKPKTFSPCLMELTGDQLQAAEEKLKSYLPQSMTVYGYVVFKNRFPTDEPVQVLVDKWPDFNVVVCKPQCEEMEDPAKQLAVFVNNKTALEMIIRESSVFDWTGLVDTDYNNVEIFKALAAEKQVSLEVGSVFLTVVMNEFSIPANPDSAPPGTSLVSLNESHVQLIYETRRTTAEVPESERYIRNLIRNFPSSCLLDSRGRPVSWITTNSYGALSMSYTHPDHRGKGYMRLVLQDLVRRLHSEGLPVFGFVKENNRISLKDRQFRAFTINPLYRRSWFKFKRN